VKCGIINSKFHPVHIPVCPKVMKLVLAKTDSVVLPCCADLRLCEMLLKKMEYIVFIIIYRYSYMKYG